MACVAISQRAQSDRTGQTGVTRANGGGDDEARRRRHRRSTGLERKTTAWASATTKRQSTTRKAVRWSSSGRRSGYVMPTTGRDDQKVETNEIRTLPPPPDGHNVRLDDDQPHGPDPPPCAMRSTPAHLQPPQRSPDS